MHCPDLCSHIVDQCLCFWLFRLTGSFLMSVLSEVSTSVTNEQLIEKVTIRLKQLQDDWIAWSEECKRVVSLPTFPERKLPDIRDAIIKKQDNVRFLAKQIQMFMKPTLHRMPAPSPLSPATPFTFLSFFGPPHSPASSAAPYFSISPSSPTNPTTISSFSSSSSFASYSATNTALNQRVICTHGTIEAAGSRQASRQPLRKSAYSTRQNAAKVQLCLRPYIPGTYHRMQQKFSVVLRPYIPGTYHKMQQKFSVVLRPYPGNLP
eukprot:g2232.t1